MNITTKFLNRYKNRKLRAQMQREDYRFIINIEKGNNR
jgi:hypothetical protein